MAEDLHLGKTPQLTVTPPSPSTPMSPSMPLQLSGFLSGDTIQVEGDTGNLHFSLKFNINNKSLPKNHCSNFHHFPSLNSLENANVVSYDQDSSFSSYMTPKSSCQEIENDQIEDLLEIENRGKPETTEKRAIIMTRLRSGAVSKVKYFPQLCRKECCRDSRSGKTMKQKRKMREKGEGLLEKLLRRRSCPVRPCSSYVFFVMASWDSVKSSNSFGEASKRLSQMWCKLPRKHKKIYEDIALKDSERYKKQCMLLNCKDQDLSSNQNSSIDSHSAN